MAGLKEREYERNVSTWLPVYAILLRVYRRIEDENYMIHPSSVISKRHVPLQEAVID